MNLVFQVYTEPHPQALAGQLQWLQADILLFVSLQVLDFWWVSFLTSTKKEMIG